LKGTTRRTLLGAVAASGAVSAASAQGTPMKQVHYREGRKPASTPLYSSAISYGNFVFISGTGVSTPSDAAGQTDRVLKSIEERLLLAGSSMEKVVKCNVYLKDLSHYDAMNGAFRGRFGPEPPVRTTIAVAGIPLKDCLVEIDVIAVR
jgi:enamine deaminase RidA (YjgF/YER057c/UK114 family)